MRQSLISDISTVRNTSANSTIAAAGKKAMIKLGFAQADSKKVTARRIQDFMEIPSM